MFSRCCSLIIGQRRSLEWKNGTITRKYNVLFRQMNRAEVSLLHLINEELCHQNKLFILGWCVHESTHKRQVFCSPVLVWGLPGQINATSCSSDGQFSHLTGLAGSHVVILGPPPPGAPGSSSPRSVGRFPAGDWPQSLSRKRRRCIAAWSKRVIYPGWSISRLMPFRKWTCCQSGKIKFGKSISLCFRNRFCCR